MQHFEGVGSGLLKINVCQMLQFLSVMYMFTNLPVIKVSSVCVLLVEM